MEVSLEALHDSRGELCRKSGDFIHVDAATQLVDLPEKIVIFISTQVQI